MHNMTEIKPEEAQKESKEENRRVSSSFVI